MGQQRKHKSKRQVGGSMMFSALSKVPFLGTFTDVMVGNSEFGPLLKALKAAGLDTHRLTRQIIARGEDFERDPVSTTIELILQEQDQLVIVLRNLAEDPVRIVIVAAAISACFSDRDGSLASYITAALQALAANPERLHKLLQNMAQVRAWLAHLFGLGYQKIMASPNAYYQNAVSPNIYYQNPAASPDAYYQETVVSPDEILPGVRPVAATLAGTNGYAQLPVVPMAGQVKRGPVLSSLASSNNYGYLQAPVGQQSNCCQCS